LFCKDCYKKKGGGVVIYVRKDIDCRIILPQSVNHSALTELLWIECCCKNVTFYVAELSPPHACYADAVLQNELRTDLIFLLNLPSPSKTVVFVVAGDFNRFNTDF
jgi:hypothetical protein